MGCAGRKIRSLSFVRPFTMRRALSSLVLATPWMSPIWPPIVGGAPGEPGEAGRVVVVVLGSPGAATGGGAPMPPPGRTNRHFPDRVIGSLYSLRRYLPFTSTSSDGGKALAF